MIIETEELKELIDRCERSQDRYGNFASVHEAMGVALEEWDELIDAVRGNLVTMVRAEALDLAAVLLRLAMQCRTAPRMTERSVK